jgi:hypothetical protein
MYSIQHSTDKRPEIVWHRRAQIARDTLKTIEQTAVDRIVNALPSRISRGEDSGIQRLSGSEPLYRVDANDNLLIIVRRLPSGSYEVLDLFDRDRLRTFSEFY